MIEVPASKQLTRRQLDRVEAALSAQFAREQDVAWGRQLIAEHRQQRDRIAELEAIIDQVLEGDLDGLVTMPERLLRRLHAAAVGVDR